MSGGPKTLFAISDVHVDVAANRAWIERLESRPEDAIILAGDVSHQMKHVRHTFRCLKAKFAEVYFCPGNHDLWADADGTSLEKLEALTRLAEDEGVRTRPHVFGEGRRVLVVPLLSWHHASFDTEPAITNWHGIPAARTVMSDYRRCRWPEPLSDADESVARHIDSLNLDDVARPRDVDDLVSFSHFLPRIELLPEKRYLFLPTLAKAVGSRFLGDRVQKLRPDLHVFGHTHLAWDATLDGVRYLQAALAYDQEWRTRSTSLAIGALASATRKRPVKLWDSDRGLVDRYRTSWSEYYDKYPRAPDITHILPPYTARLYRPLPGSQVKPVGEHVPPFSDADAPTAHLHNPTAAPT